MSKGGGRTIETNVKTERKSGEQRTETRGPLGSYPKQVSRVHYTSLREERRGQKEYLKKYCLKRLQFDERYEPINSRSSMISK